LAALARASAVRPSGKALECRAFLLYEKGRGKHRRVGAGKPVPGRSGESSGEEKENPREQRPRTAFGRSRGTDPRGEQDLEAAGHRDLLVLRAAGRDVKNSKKGSGAERRTAPRGGKALKGNPMSGTDLRGREATEGANRQEGEKPWRRNEPGWTPGSVDLLADVAVGAQNLKRVVGSEGGRPGRTGGPEGESKLRGVVGAHASTARISEDREAVETAGRGS
jgi:hypothetical protein